MEPSIEILEALRLERPIARPAVVVAAHPDDETVSAGGRLASFSDLTLVHVTDGAPRDGADARRSGFATWRDYRAARAKELDAAVEALGLSCRRVALEVPDQEAARRLPDLARRIARLLDGAELVVTHAFEWGHPDHDAAAFAVQAACALIARGGGSPPPRIEFGGYRFGARGGGGPAFTPAAGHPEIHAVLSPGRLARKHRALDCFVSQPGISRAFDGSREAYRQAPEHDFTRPAPGGRARYDDWGFSIDSRAWSDEARAALAALDL